MSRPTALVQVPGVASRTPMGRCVTSPSDVAIVIVGNHPTCNAGWISCPNPSDGKEGVDRKSLNFPEEELIRKICAANRRTVACASIPERYLQTDRSMSV